VHFSLTLAHAPSLARVPPSCLLSGPAPPRDNHSVSPLLSPLLAPALWPFSWCRCGCSLDSHLVTGLPLCQVSQSSLSPILTAPDRCVCLGPPCLFNLSAARRTDSLITSVIIGDDFAARLSFGSCYDLRDACLSLHSTLQTEDTEIEPDKTPATEGDHRTLVDLILSRTGYDQSSPSSLYQYPPLIDPSTAVVDSVTDHGLTLPPPPVELFEYSQFTAVEPTPQLLELEEQRQETLQSLGYLMERLQTNTMTADKLFPPGRIIHIVDRDVWQAGLARGDLGPLLDHEQVLSEDHRSVAYLCDQEHFSSLQLSGKMFSSHLPTEYLTRLRELFPLTT
jgi:hypothetical protein